MGVGEGEEGGRVKGGELFIKNISLSNLDSHIINIF